MEEQEPSALKEDPRDFALWKATKEGEDTSWPSPWGQGRPGWHIECSAMAEHTIGEEFEIHGGGLDLVFPHHENELAQSRALGHPFARIWAHNGMLRFTGEKMSKSVGNIATIREVLDEYGREAVLVFFLGGHWRKPIDFSPDTMAQAAAQAEGLRNVFRGPSEPGGDWEAFAAALDDDFNTPEALALMHEWRDHDLLRRALSIFGLGSLADRDDAPPEVVELAERRVAARAAARVRRRRCAPRTDRGRRLGDARRAGRRVHARPEAVSSDLVYGRRAVREALRGRREVLELLATDRAAAAEPWLAEARPKIRAERELTELAGTRDHQGVVARVEPYRYADAYELAAAERPLLAVLDRVTDPRNLGAVCRSAEGAGATGVVVPAHGSAVVTPAVARASAGAIEHLPIAVVTNLARYLEEVKGPELWVYGAAGDAPRRRCGTPISRAASRSSSAPRGRGCGRSSAAAATSLVSIPLDRRGRVAERQRRRGAPPVRGAPPAALADG